MSNAFRSRYERSLPDRAILTSENFRAFPSIGQLVEGYLLIAPLDHYTAIDAMPMNIFGEYAGICRRVRTALSDVYGPCIFFEHGARAPVNGGCGIYHAHLHATPLAGIQDPIQILRATFPYRELETLEEIRHESARLPTYLFYEDAESRLYLFDTGPLPSQYMRKLIADALHDSNWNWRTAGREERLLTTMERLSGRFDGTLKDTRPSQITNVSR
jgi:diadenosine tetraphosphate (Ap4A) HIT family hydrolase